MGVFRNDGQNIPGYPLPSQATVRGANGTIYAVSSFGVEDTTFGPSFRPQALVECERHRVVDFRRRFYKCTQHDHKIYDMAGRMNRGGQLALQQPLLSSQPPAFYVPLDQRRPNNPYRLARLIVQAFTSFVFGEGRFPKLRCTGDTDAEDFAEALIQASDLPTVMIRARNMGGSCGSVALSWRFYQGKPCVRVHSAANVYIHEWIDRDEGLVAHASEIYLVYRDQWDPQKKRVDRVPHWYRRDWTPTADIVFVEQPMSKEGGASEWVVNEEQTVIHDDGFSHFVWIPNQPNDDEENGYDGEPDYEGLYEQTTTIDLLNSVLSTGTVRNLDPTLVLRISAEQQAMMARGVSKGSDNALAVGESGDAKYLELGGTAAQTGIALLKQQRQFALEVAQCVIPDPNEIAAAATSGSAIRLLYAPMGAKASTYQTQYGKGIVQLVTQMISSARRRMPTVNEDGSLEYPLELDGDSGMMVPVEYYLDLPPRPVTEEAIGDDGLPTGEMKVITYEQRVPGTGRIFTCEWPKRFAPSDTDDQAAAATMSTSTGSKAFVSQRTAVEAFARRMGRDPQEEWKRVLEEQQRREERELGMFPGTGGAVNGQTTTETTEDPIDDQDTQEAPVMGEQQGGGEIVPPAPGQEMSVEPSLVLNGAQIQAALSIVQQVIAQQIPRDTAIGLLKVGFNMTDAQAGQVLGSAGVGFVPAQEGNTA
jgi:hypothetical protein